MVRYNFTDKRKSISVDLLKLKIHVHLTLTITEHQVHPKNKM